MSASAIACATVVSAAIFVPSAPSPVMSDCISFTRVVASEPRKVSLWTVLIAACRALSRIEMAAAAWAWTSARVLPQLGKESVAAAVVVVVLANADEAVDVREPATVDSVANSATPAAACQRFPHRFW